MVSLLDAPLLDAQNTAHTLLEFPKIDKLLEFTSIALQHIYLCDYMLVVISEAR